MDINISDCVESKVPSCLLGKEQGSDRDEMSDVSTKCLPCREGCPYCRDDTPCLVQEDGALRLAVASFQGLCMVLDLASMVVVYHFRRNKVRWNTASSHGPALFNFNCMHVNSLLVETLLCLEVQKIHYSLQLVQYYITRLQTAALVLHTVYNL